MNKDVASSESERLSGLGFITVLYILVALYFQSLWLGVGIKRCGPCCQRATSDTCDPNS